MRSRSALSATTDRIDRQAPPTKRQRLPVREFIDAVFNERKSTNDPSSGRANLLFGRAVKMRETPTRAMDKVKGQAEARRTGLRVAGTSADRQGPDPDSAGKGGGDGGISH